MKAGRFISSLCLLLVVTSSAFAQKVNVDWERGANFTRYRTFAWGACEDLEELQLWGPRIVQDIESQLAARGFRKAPLGQQPDVIVSYRSDVEERVSFVGFDYGYGQNWGPGPGPGPALGWGPTWGWGWSGGPFTMEPVVQREFVLTVDMVDARRNQPLWRGAATDALSRKSEKNVRRLRKAVVKLFENYPYGD
ncbi:MAG TPA: DUF4136 domain-containing protein [Blastocatellia bacterium]|nr:DUF4136 domain-containing protein [Blastocatellia bacterium]